MAGVTRKSFRLWAWQVVSIIAAKKRHVIRWENRFRADRGKTCKVAVDGVDFPILEPAPFDSQWFSHKFRGPGIRYEVAVCIQTGDIVWVNGPFKCGKYPDVKIFKEGLMHHLGVNELVEADRGYRGRDVKARTPDDFVSRTDRRAKGRARARHETVNRRLKQWGCMGQKWRHFRHKHKLAFCAVVVITQIVFESGERPFQCRY
ncbi:hypothetical protein MHU86_13552 [Fragilaria crotonensis]|nr:hypothetical protein MHU86_13552 [Fragilaria crotonensis]